MHWREFSQAVGYVVVNHGGLLVFLVFVYGFVLFLATATGRGWRWVGTTLAVVVVTGLLGAMLLPALSRAKKSARSASSKNNLKQIGLGIAQYYDDNTNTTPATLRDILPYLGIYGATHSVAGEKCRRWAKPMMEG